MAEVGFRFTPATGRCGRCGFPATCLLATWSPGKATKIKLCEDHEGEYRRSMRQFFGPGNSGAVRIPGLDGPSLRR